MNWFAYHCRLSSSEQLSVAGPITEESICWHPLDCLGCEDDCIRVVQGHTVRTTCLHLLDLISQDVHPEKAPLGGLGEGGQWVAVLMESHEKI